MFQQSLTNVINFVTNNADFMAKLMHHREWDGAILKFPLQEWDTMSVARVGGGGNILFYIFVIPSKVQ